MSYRCAECRAPVEFADLEYLHGLDPVCAFTVDARKAVVEMVELRSTAVDGVLRLTPDGYHRLGKAITLRDRARMLGVDVDAIEIELNDGLGEIKVVVIPPAKHVTRIG